MLYHEIASCSNCPKLTIEIKALTRQLTDFAEKERSAQSSAAKKIVNEFVKCTACPTLAKENEYLKDTLERFSFGKKNLNMILDKSKVSVKHHCLGFNFVEHAKNNPPEIIKLLEPGKIEVESEPKQIVFKSAGIAKDSSTKVSTVKRKDTTPHQDKYQCTHCGRDGHLVQFCF